MSQDSETNDLSGPMLTEYRRAEFDQPYMSNRGVQSVLLALASYGRAQIEIEAMSMSMSLFNSKQAA